MTKAAEDAAPHPAMPESTGALCQQFLADLPPYDAKRLAHLVMPGPGRKAEQLNWALRPEALGQILEADAADPSRVFVGVFDADSVPDPDTLRWIAGEELAGRRALAYQGVTLSLGELERARYPRPHLRHPAVVDLHARVAGAPRQRGVAHPPHRPL